MEITTDSLPLIDTLVKATTRLTNRTDDYTFKTGDSGNKAPGELANDRPITRSAFFTAMVLKPTREALKQGSGYAWDENDIKTLREAAKVFLHPEAVDARVPDNNQHTHEQPLPPEELVKIHKKADEFLGFKSSSENDARRKNEGKLLSEDVNATELTHDEIKIIGTLLQSMLPPEKKVELQDAEFTAVPHTPVATFSVIGNGMSHSHSTNGEKKPRGAKTRS